MTAPTDLSPAAPDDHTDTLFPEFDEFDVDKGDQLSCPECGSNLEVTGLSPLELDIASDEDDEDDDDLEDDDDDADDDDDDDPDDEDDDKDEDGGWDE